MSVRLRVIANSITAMFVLNCVCIAIGFILFWFVANPYVGARLNENAGHIAARYFSIGGVTVAILTGIGAMWVIGTNIKRVTGPLAKVKRAVAEISEGNLGYELVVTGNDEFTELSAGLEQMRIRLKDSMFLKENAEAERRTMIASVTHDLQTPITSILGYSDGILDRVADTPEKIREYAAVINKKARSLQVLAEDLSLLSNLENAALSLDLREENLSSLTHELISEYSLNEQGIAVEMNLSPDLMVLADKEKLARVILNIMQNAVKYKKPEQDRADVTVKLVKQDGEALLTVSDMGIGIPHTDLPYIFNHFYRVDASRNVQNGSGLGLSIARRLVDLHEGKIWIISNPGGGISVNITLPLRDLSIFPGR